MAPAAAVIADAERLQNAIGIDMTPEMFRRARNHAQGVDKKPATNVEYQRQLLAAEYAHAEVIDSGRDLSIYAKIKLQSSFCSPPASPSTQAYS